MAVDRQYILKGLESSQEEQCKNGSMTTNIPLIKISYQPSQKLNLLEAVNHVKQV